MEHLIPRGERSPIRVPKYEPRPDDDGKLQSVDDCTGLFDAAVKQETWPDSENETTALWREHCHKGRVYNLCHVLLDQFYFGLIYQILGPDVVIADFTVRDDDGSVFLTTAKLEDYLLAWKARVDRLEDEQRLRLAESVYSMLYQRMLVLRSLMAFLRYSYKHVPVKQAYPDDNEPLGNTHFACALLHQALVSARMQVFGIQDANGNYELGFPAPWLERRMEREGWCCYILTMLKLQYFIDSVAYAYFLATVRTDTADHGYCSTVQCFANNIPPVEGSTVENSSRHYGLKHVNAGCDCWIIEAPLGEINALLQEGHLPVLRISTDDGYKLTLNVRKADPDTGKYIALSHVWVDGLGSPHSNTITQCQLTRIANRLGKLETTESCGELCIWIDTLCIPVDSRYKHLRDVAIMNMHKVYKDAYAVMVMDADLLMMQPYPSFEELGMRLRLSAWSSRLWTYQEGSLNKRLLVMTIDSLLDVDKYLSSWIDGNSMSKLQHRIATYALGSIMQIRGLQSSNRTLLAQAYNFIHNHDKHETFEAAVQVLLNDILARTSSRGDDEVIVVATYLDLPLQSILARFGHEKVIALLQAMPSIPQCILFAEGERLPITGFKWCPRSFIRARGGNGLQVFYTNTQAWPAGKLDDASRGLWTFNAAIKLHRVLQYEPEGENDGPRMAFELSGALYLFDPHSADSYLPNRDSTVTLGAVMEQMFLKKKELVILVPGSASIQPASQRERVTLLELTAGADKARDEVDVMARYIMPGYIHSPEAAGPYASEAITEAMEADGHVPGDYRAEWIEPKYWLVD